MRLLGKNIFRRGGLMNKQYYKQYYTTHAEDYKRRKRLHKKRQPKETEPEKTPEERKKAIAEWIEYMDKKY